MLVLHENILGRLYEVVPDAEYNQRFAKEIPTIRIKGHVRWHSADSVTNRMRDSRLARKLRHSLDIVRHPRELPVASVADPRTAAAVAAIFAEHVRTWATTLYFILIEA